MYGANTAQSCTSQLAWQCTPLYPSTPLPPDALCIAQPQASSNYSLLHATSQVCVTLACQVKRIRVMFCMRLVTPLNMVRWPAKFSFVATAMLIASSTMRSELMCTRATGVTPQHTTQRACTIHHRPTPTHVTRVCLHRLPCTGGQPIK